jgi:hypothetical protein
MRCQLHFLLLALASALVRTLSAQHFDPNPIISGFSTCYIDLVLFTETQEFQEPPQIPVTVTYSVALKQKGSNEGSLTALCNMKWVKTNCLAIFIILPKDNAKTDVQDALNRYFRIVNCYIISFGGDYVKNTYLTAVQHQSSNGDYKSIRSEWRQVRHLPIFYLRTSVGTVSNKVSVAVEFQSPCSFYLSMELLSMDNLKQAFDKVFERGQRNNCVGLAWMIKELTTNATSPCISFTNSQKFYEQQTSAIVSAVSEPFANSTAFNADKFGKMDSLEVKRCLELLDSHSHVQGVVHVLTGFEAASKIFRDNKYPTYEIIYEEAYNFLTCDGAEDYLSFEGYASPFFWELWVGIVMISFMILLFLIAFLHFKRISARIMLLIPSVFLEQPPQFSGQLLDYLSFKYLLVSLLLATTVLSNSYKSVVTTHLTAPFSTKRVETFDEAVRLVYKILPPLNSVMAIILLGYEAFYENRTIEIQKKPEIIQSILEASLLTKALLTEVSLPNTISQKRVQSQSQNMLNLIGAPENFPSVSFQMEMSKCNKSIYVDHDFELDQFRSEVLILGNGNLKSKLYKGKESFQKQLFSWRIAEMGWDRSDLILKRWSSLSHSGIFSRLDYVYRIGKMKSLLRKYEKLFGAKEEESFRPLTLNSTVMSIFIVYLACVSFSISILIAEMMHNFFHDHERKLKAWILNR